jgi:hypothetical protein
VNVSPLVAVPAPVVTLTVPLVPFAGTTNVSVVDETRLNFTESPFRRSVVVPSRFVPVTVTVVPGGPLVGATESISGATTNLPELVAVPPGVMTAIVPVVPSAGTVNVIVAESTASNAASSPLS